jgi:hypothetical protein
MADRALTDRQLTDDDVDAIARAVVRLMPRAGVPYLLTVPEVAEMVTMGTDWVRDHAAQLGGVRLGDGTRGELRFEAEKVRAFVEKRRLAVEEKERTGRRPGPKPQPPGEIELIELPSWAA